MYNLHKLIIWFTIVISPARMIAALPVLLPAPVNAQAAVSSAPYHLTLDTTKAQAITVVGPKQPDFDSDVLVPLRATQAAEAQVAAQTAAANAAAVKVALAQKAAAVAPAVSGDAALAQLRYCEAGGDYTRNSGNGYFGAYQYSAGTWNGYGGYALPNLAPAAVQDAKAQADIARRGWSAWPACGRKIAH